MSKHASIRLGGFTIPLIGVPQDATLQECDCCHDIFPIQDIEIVGTQLLCVKCRLKS